MEALHQVYLRVLKAEVEQREAKEKHEALERKLIQGTKHPTTLLEATSQAPKLEEGTRLNLKPARPEDNCTPNGNADLQARAAQLREMWHFLHKSCWRATDGTRNGTSWLELLARYCRLGGRGCEPPAEDLFARRPTAKQQLAFFVTSCRRIVERYGDDEARRLFKPAQCKDHRLQSYGIKMHLPSISAELCLTKEAAQKQHQDLVQLVTPLTKNKLQSLADQQLRVRTQKLQLRKRLPWKEGEPSLLRELANKTLKGEEEGSNLSPESALAKPQLFLLSWHVCGSTRNGTHTALLRKGQWASLYCSQCKLSRKASKWKCLCNKPWHTCSIHHAVGFKCKPMTKNFKPKARSKPLPPLGVSQPLRTPQSKAKNLGHDNERAAVGVDSRKGFSSPVVGCADSDGVTGVQSQGGPLPKRAKISPPPPRAPSDRTSVKRKLPVGAPAVTDRIVSHILAKRAKLAAKLQATTRPPE